MVFSNNATIQELSYMVLCLLKLVWWDSSVRLCNWYLIDSRDLVLDCFCVSKVILILCEDTCMLPKESLASLSAQVYILQLTDQLDILRAVLALVLLWIL